MVEKFPNPGLGIEKTEVIAGSKRHKKVKNCIAIKKGAIPTILEIVRAATENEAIIKDEPDQYLVQFPGQGQELLTYSEIFKKLESFPGDKN